MEVFPVVAGEYLFDTNSPVQVLLTEESLTSVLHQHDFMEIAYVLEGEGIQLIAGDKIQIAKGDLFVIPPEVSHVFQPRDLSGTQPLRILNCMLSPEVFKLPAALPALFTGPFEEEQQRRLRLLEEQKSWFGYHGQGRELEALFRRMEDLHNNCPSADPLRLYPLLFELLRIVEPCAGVPFSDRLQQADDPLHDVILYMVSNFKQRISLKEISRYISMSSRQFQRLFKLKTGKSYIQVFQEIRMKYSCALLMFTDFGIQKIALEVGIGDMKYFYRLFREYSGMTPGNYRNWGHSHFSTGKEMKSYAEHPAR
ncbi:AraC family transcriptional regulator [Paenibacillus sp. FSL L8-0436]|uniref:AraC family transcriptional regulator n=1 Tax=Paenibacillus sp. FSL L8-0436 TaxID=2954686 RepID=UPI003158EF64